MGDGFGSFFNLVFLCGCERPYPTFREVWGNSQPHIFLQSDRQTMDRQNCICLWEGYLARGDKLLVSVPFPTFKVWGRLTASHFRQSDGQTMDRKKSARHSSECPYAYSHAQVHTHTHARHCLKVWRPWSCLGQLIALPT